MRLFETSCSRTGRSMSPTLAALIGFSTKSPLRNATRRRSRHPMLDDVQTFVDLTAERLAVQVPAQEDRLSGAAELGERLVGRVLDVVAGEAAQDRLGLGGAEAQSRRVLHHLVVLL